MWGLRSARILQHCWKSTTSSCLRTTTTTTEAGRVVRGLLVVRYHLFEMCTPSAPFGCASIGGAEIRSIVTPEAFSLLYRLLSSIFDISLWTLDHRTIFLESSCVFKLRFGFCFVLGHQLYCICMHYTSRNKGNCCKPHGGFIIFACT